MSIRARMIIPPLSIVLHYCITKISDLTFIRCNNVQLQYCLMAVITSVHAPSWHDNVHACALTFLYHIHYVNSDLRHNFCIDGCVVFLSLRFAKSYPRTISLYDLCIYFPFSFLSTLWRLFFVPFSFVSTPYPVLSPSVSTLDSILSPPVSMLESISYCFDLNLTIFPAPSLVEGGPIWRVSTFFHPIITSQNFANRDPFRALVKKSVRICSLLQYSIHSLLLLTLSLANK